MRTVDSRGYIRVQGDNGKLIYEHTKVAEEKLGRRLGPNEVVHHINGIKGDNSPNNLLVLRTDSDHSKIEGHSRSIEILKTKDGSHICILDQIECANCHRVFVPDWFHQRFCSVSCATMSHRKISDIDIPTLTKQVWEMPTTQVAKLYGVSDKAIEKWCTKLGIEKPGRGYWVRKTFGYE